MALKAYPNPSMVTQVARGSPAATAEACVECGREASRPAEGEPDASDVRGMGIARRRLGMATSVYTAIIERDGDLYAALCPELDVASQGATVEEATANLREAVELFLDCAGPAEVSRRLRTEVFVTRIVATHG